MRQIISTLLFIVFFMDSCSKGPDYLKSYGIENEVYKELQGFSGIEVGQKFKIYLSNDTNRPESIKIKYGSHLQEKIEATVEQGILKISDKNHYNWVRNLNVHPICYINAHHINHLGLNGACTLVSLDSITESNLEIKMDGVGSHELHLNCGQVYGSCTNSGNITFRGWGGILAWSCENGGWIDARNMESADVYLYHYTDRDVFVNPGIIFKANLYGKGNAYFYRTPWLKFEISESGKGKAIKE